MIRNTLGLRYISSYSLDIRNIHQHSKEKNTKNIS